MNEHFTPEPSALTMFGLYVWLFLQFGVPYLLGIGGVFYAMWRVLIAKDISRLLKCFVFGLFLLAFGYWGLAIFLS